MRRSCNGSVFNDAGIYLLIDVNSPLPNESIDGSDPASSYNAAYLNRTFAIVEAFKIYPNTLLYFAGNEVISDIPIASTAPYIRAVTRDLKNYIAKHSNRTIAVGHSPSRGVSGHLVLPHLHHHRRFTRPFSIGRANTSVPIFFSEFGCNTVPLRPFTEIQAIYGPQMTSTLSSGVVYEYSEDVNDYCLVVLNNNGSAQLLIDYNTLQKQYNMLNFTNLEGSRPLNTSNAPSACSSGMISNSGFPTNFTISSPPPGAQDLIDNGVPSPNIGQLIDVTDFQVSQIVQYSDGVVIVGLAVKQLPAVEENGPGQNIGITSTSGSAPTATGAAPAASTSKKRLGAVMTL